MRFDLNCRVEVWVTVDDIESSRNYRNIVNAPGLSIEARIAKLKELAVAVAQEKLSSYTEGVKITCDGPVLTDANIDRIDWNTLAASDAEKQTALDAEEADYERRFPS